MAMLFAGIAIGMILGGLVVALMLIDKIKF